MLISKVSGFGFNGKNINPKKVQSTAEKIYVHGANLEKSLISNEAKTVTVQTDSYYPFASSTGNGYLNQATENSQKQLQDKTHEYLSASMIIEKEAKK